MKKYLLIAAGLILCLPVHGQERSTVMNDVTIWYDAFNKRDATLAQKVMSEDWIDIPAAPGQPPGRKGCAPQKACPTWPLRFSSLATPTRKRFARAAEARPSC